jgi:pyridoxal/pyridoxine/pyridoxamine kinase
MIRLLLDQVNEGMITWNRMNAQAEGYRASATEWRSKAVTFANKAKGLAEDDPQRAKLEKLAKEALDREQEFLDLLVPLEAAIEKSRDDYEAAITALEQDGYSRKQILSERDVLRIEVAGDELKKKLAEAKRGGGDLKAQAMIKQLREDALTAKAEARAASTIADTLPPTEAEIDAEAVMITRKDRVDAAFAELMAS